jgi:predicted nuclease of restriction endonuclease-like (RecB) superfamily
MPPSHHRIPCRSLPRLFAKATEKPRRSGGTDPPAGALVSAVALVSGAKTAPGTSALLDRSSRDRTIGSFLDAEHDPVDESATWEGDMPAKQKKPVKKRSTRRGAMARSGRAVEALPAGYAELLEELKARIRSAQVKAVVAVNRELLLLYWDIGREILQRQRQEGWGAKVIDRLGDELRRAFPAMKGLSPRNIKYMRAFAEAYPDAAFVQQAAAQIPWFHNCVILDKVKESATHVWYVHKALENNWSRNVLTLQIDSRLHERQGRAVTNFERTLPKPQSGLARELLKDPYQLDFLHLREDVEERLLEDELVTHITRFLLELGQGFAFVGRQVRLVVDDDEYFLDLLFYHVRLHCFIALELKARDFRPEDAGKLNFYLSAVDDLLRTPGDGPTIGLILCRRKKRFAAEYALRDLAKPIGVAGFELRLVESLPKELEGKLPTIERLEEELDKIDTKNAREGLDAD